jgi:release factor glutamine methyltransferase
MMHYQLQSLFQDPRYMTMPSLEQTLLAGYALNQPRSWVLAHDTDNLSLEQFKVVETVLKRRYEGEPVAYIVEKREFYGLSFQVNPAVLIPRPETELLVDWVIQYAPLNACILDLGTGSGAIAISIAIHRPDCKVVAVDLSLDALHIALNNAIKHGLIKDNHNNHYNDYNIFDTFDLTTQFQLIQSNWCDYFIHYNMNNHHTLLTFDMIISNPPYIAIDDKHLQQGDLRFEPISALTDYSATGLKHYHTIAHQALILLKPIASSTLILEHGWQQGEALQTLLHGYGYTHITQHYDLGLHNQPANPRMIVAQLTS